MSAQLTTEQRSLVEKAALASNFKDFEIIVDVGSSKGDNYLGVLQTITVKEKTGRVLYLILKSAHNNDIVREKSRAHYAFLREAYVYDTIIARFCKLEGDKAISRPFTGAADYYGSHLEEKKELILMQNLKGYGYKMWDRKKPMNDLHITLVFEEYARFHAASTGLKHLHPDEFQDLTKDIHLNIFEGLRKPSTEFFAGYFRTGLAAVSSNTKAAAGLNKIKDNILSLFYKSHTEGIERFVVIHGDCWCNNMLFKYEDDQKTPSKVCFIDWQLSKLASPATDLAYFFSACGSKETYPNLGKYLKTYYEVFSQNLKEFGCNPEEVFSYEALLEEWNRSAWYGVFMSLMVIKLMLSDSEEAPELKEGTDNILDALTDFDTSQLGEYSKRLCDLLEFMVDNDYI